MGNTTGFLWLWDFFWSLFICMVVLPRPLFEIYSGSIIRLSIYFVQLFKELYLLKCCGSPLTPEDEQIESSSALPVLGGNLK